MELDPAVTTATTVPDDLLYLHAAEMTFAVRLFSSPKSYAPLIRPVQRYRPSGRRKKVALTVCAPLPDSFVRLCADLMLPLPERYVNGGLYVNGKSPHESCTPRLKRQGRKIGQLVQSSHPILEDLGGRWMPQPLEAVTATPSKPSAPKGAQCQTAPTLHRFHANETTQDDRLVQAVTASNP